MKNLIYIFIFIPMLLFAEGWDTGSLGTASETQNGILSFDDWTTFNDRADLSAAETISGNWVNTTNPWATNELVTAVVIESDLTANDFNVAAGVVSLDYVNGQEATSGQDGFLSSTDWTTFNGKQSALVNSAGLRGALSDETGTGAAVFANNPTFTDSIEFANGALLDNTQTDTLKISETLIKIYGEFGLADGHTVWRQYDVDPTVWKHPSSNSMATNIEANFSTLDADPDTDESIYYIWEIPTAYNPGDSCFMMFSGFTDGAVASGDTNVVLGMEYKLLSAGDAFAFSSTTTILDTITWTGDAKKITQCQCLRFVPTGFIHGKHVLVRYYRDANNNADDYDGDYRTFGLHVMYKSDLRSN